MPFRGLVAQVRVLHVLYTPIYSAILTRVMLFPFALCFAFKDIIIPIRASPAKCISPVKCMDNLLPI